MRGAEEGNGGEQRDRLRRSHPVNAIHEVDEVDEPQSTDEQNQTFQAPRQIRGDAQVLRQRKDDGGDDQRLQQQTRHNGKRADVIDRADARHCHRGADDDRQRCCCIAGEGMGADCNGARHDHGGNDGYAGALRGRRDVG